MQQRFNNFRFSLIMLYVFSFSFRVLDTFLGFCFRYLNSFKIVAIRHTVLLILKNTFVFAILNRPSSKRLATSIYLAFDASSAGDGCFCCKMLKLKQTKRV